MKDINDFINKIKNQDELMTLDEVDGIITEPSPGFLAAKWKQIGTLAIAVLGTLTALFWLWPSDTQNVYLDSNQLNTEQVQDSAAPLTNQDNVHTNDTSTEERLASVGEIASAPASQEEVELKTGKTSLEQAVNETQQRVTTSTAVAKEKTTPSQLENSSEKSTTYRPIANTTTSTPIMPAEQNTTPTTTIFPAPKPLVSKTSSGPTSEKYYYDAWNKAPQTFSVSLDKPNVIKGKEGTIIIIPKGAICGTYVSFTGEVKLTEYYKKEDMLLAQLSTGSGHNMLESAGMITLTAASDGKELKLCKDVTVLFPSDKYLDSSYIGFKGTWDAWHNVIDWTANGGGNVNFFGGSLTPNCTRPTYEAIRCNWPTRKAELRKWGKSDLRKDLRNDEVVRRIRKRFWFQDSVTSELYDQVYEGIKYKMKDTLSARAYHDCRIKQAKAAKLQAMLDSLRGEFGFDPFVLNQKSGYILANVSGFGSINCDRFTKYRKVSDHTYKVGGSEGVLSARLLFHDIKSILPGKQTAKDEVTFTRIPDGLNATLLVIKYADSTIQIAHQAMETGANPDLQFERIAKDELPKKLKAITSAIGNPKTEILARRENPSSKWQRIADSLGAIFLSDEQLEEFDIHKYDDVLLFSKTDNKNRYQVCLTESGRNQYSLSGLSQQWKEEQPVLVVSQNDIHYGSRNLEKVKSETDNHFTILVPFNIQSDDYTLWYFEKNKATIKKLPKDILVNNFNANDIFTFTEKTDSTRNNEKTVIEVRLKEYEQGQVIIPSNDLLNRLRITLDDEGIFYQSKGQIGDNNSISLKGYRTESSYGNMNILPKPSDFAPSFFTKKPIPSLPTSVTEFHSLNKRKLNSAQYFYAHKQDMIAIPLLKPDSTEVVFWYEDTASILSLLAPLESRKIREYLATTNGLDLNIVSKENNGDKALIDMMQEFKELKALSINPVILNDKALLNLGIENNGKSITLYRQGGKMTLTKRRTYHSFTLSEADRQKIASASPLHISDKFGKGYRMKTMTIDSNQNLDRLIPIYVGTNEKYHLSDYFDDYFHPDCIFWYEPTEGFLDLLPSDIREQLQYELTLISDATEIENPQTDSTTNAETSEAKSCIYLDPCSDIKTNLKGVTIYPNPTKGEVTLKIVADAIATGMVSVNNLAGQELKTVSLADIRQGTTIDLSDLPSGIYLVTLLTKEGDKITRRVIRR